MPAPKTIPCGNCEKSLSTENDDLYRCGDDGDPGLVCRQCLLDCCAVNDVEETMRSYGFWIEGPEDMPRVGGPGA